MPIDRWVDEWEYRVLNKSIISESTVVITLNTALRASFLGRIPNRSLLPIHMVPLGRKTIGGSALRSAHSGQQGAGLGFGREDRSVQCNQIGRRRRSCGLRSARFSRRSTLGDTSPSVCCSSLLSGFCFVHAVVIKWTFRHPETRHRRRWEDQ